MVHLTVITERLTRNINNLVDKVKSTGVLEIDSHDFETTDDCYDFSVRELYENSINNIINQIASTKITSIKIQNFSTIMD